MSLAEEKRAWQSYIKFELDKNEPNRARQLYERALISLDLDLHFWLGYITFIQHTLKDVSLARAKFESRRASTSSLNMGDLVELMIENAMFEEEQQQLPKARLLYENLTNDVAPGHVKAMLAFVSFERRMGSNERVKELFYKAFNAALAKSDQLAVTYIGMQYARFLAFKSNEVGRACDILDQATGVIKNSKVLYLSQLNLLKHLEGLGLVQHWPAQQGKQRALASRVTDVYERALFESELTASDKREIGTGYLDYVREIATNVSQVRSVQAKLRDANILQTAGQHASEGIGAAATETQELIVPPGGGVLGKRQRTF